MLYLIQYDRRGGRIVEFEAFEDEHRAAAEDKRLSLELRLNRSGQDSEVVLLDAADENAVRRTHRRYFEDITTLATETATTSGTTSMSPTRVAGSE